VSPGRRYVFLQPESEGCPTIRKLDRCRQGDTQAQYRLLADRLRCIDGIIQAARRRVLRRQTGGEKTEHDGRSGRLPCANGFLHHPVRAAPRRSMMTSCFLRFLRHPRPRSDFQTEADCARRSHIQSQSVGGKILAILSAGDSPVLSTRSTRRSRRCWASSVTRISVRCQEAGPGRDLHGPEQVPGIVEQCGEAGILGSSSSLPVQGDGREGRALEERIDEIRRRYDGCGFSGRTAWGSSSRCEPEHQLRKRSSKDGSIAFISQSGALCSSVLDWALEKKSGSPILSRSATPWMSISGPDRLLRRRRKDEIDHLVRGVVEPGAKVRIGARAFARTKRSSPTRLEDSRNRAGGRLPHRRDGLRGRGLCSASGFSRAISGQGWIQSPAVILKAIAGLFALLLAWLVHGRRSETNPGDAFTCYFTVMSAMVR